MSKKIIFLVCLLLIVFFINDGHSDDIWVQNFF